VEVSERRGKRPVRIPKKSLLRDSVRIAHNQGGWKELKGRNSVRILRFLEAPVGSRGGKLRPHTEKPVGKGGKQNMPSDEE